MTLHAPSRAEKFWLFVFLAFWCFFGLTGRDAWKPEEALALRPILDWLAHGGLAAGSPAPFHTLFSGLFAWALHGWLNVQDAARLGSGAFIVVEADESDASFLHLQPVIAVVTNIDADHMETYQHDFARLKQAFVQFLQNLPFYGSAILCADDAHVREILPFVSKPVLTYGFAAEAAVRAEADEHAAGAMRFRAWREKAAPLDVTLNLPGRHNVQNALAAIAVATELAVPDRAIQKALAEFHGVGRRFQRLGGVAHGLHQRSTAGRAQVGQPGMGFSIDPDRRCRRHT